MYTGDEFIEVYTGRATPLMCLATPIPPSIDFFLGGGGKEKINVFYPDQPKTCFIRHSEDHDAKDCQKIAKIKEGRVS